jgi:hypothetical protein
MEKQPRPKDNKDRHRPATDVNSIPDEAGSNVLPDSDAPVQTMQPDGVRWRDAIYLVSTSDVDGRRRWETIILLLAQKLQDTKVQSALPDLKSRE